MTNSINNINSEETDITNELPLNEEVIFVKFAKIKRVKNENNEIIWKVFNYDSGLWDTFDAEHKKLLSYSSLLTENNVDEFEEYALTEEQKNITNIETIKASPIISSHVDTSSFNETQLKVWEALTKTNDNLFITGDAGTGKSYLINKYREYAPLTPTVSFTGTAALLVGGVTFSSFFSLGFLEDTVIKKMLTKIKEQPYYFADLHQRISATEELIIDEISMLPKKALFYAEKMCRLIRQNEEPWGGIRIIIVGDFCQLPPIPDDNINDRRPWAFKSKVWKKSNLKMFHLKEIVRTDETNFHNILKKVRRGICDQDVTNFLNSRLVHNEAFFDDFEGTRLFAKKELVERYNTKRLRKIKSELYEIPTKFEGSKEVFINAIKKSMPIPEVLELKVGALVMIRYNLNPQAGLVNGALATVKEVTENNLMIELKSDKSFHILGKHLFEYRIADVDKNNKVVYKIAATAFNFPVVLAWAITGHKAQGATLDAAMVDIRNLWDSGQAYVSLSRVVSYKNLYVLGWDKNSIFLDKEVIEFYRERK